MEFEVGWPEGVMIGIWVVDGRHFLILESWIGGID
jgi:hypothetical protein